MTPVRLFLLALACVLPAVALPATLQLPPGVPIVLAADAPGPIQRATADLQRDLARVLGTASPIVAVAPTDRGCIEILAPDARLGAPETHVLRCVTSPNAPARVVLSGSDSRGVIYAIYTFSERFLGVPPLWFFADWKPTRLAAVEVPADLTLAFPAPHVRWRGWFPNDEDMFEPWEKLAPEEHFDRILETMLRLKLNLTELGDFADYPVNTGLARARHARDRGLAITNTHTSPLGASWSHWHSYWRNVRHQEPPPLRLDQLSAMKEFWTYHIELCQREGFEMIWDVGFRGSGDHSFATLFPDAPPDDAGRAKVIHDMLAAELGLVRAHHGDGPLRLRTIIYNESSDYLAAGLLQLPADPNLIWNFVAARRDHFPAADIRSGVLPPTQPFGYYLNFQFTSTGAHLAQAEGPWKMARNFEIISGESPRPLEVWTVNVGNFREFIREMSAHAQMAWAPAGWTPDGFLQQWCAQYFGPANAAAAAAVIRDYYNSYWTQRAPDLANFPRQYIFQDMRVARASEDLLSEWTEPVKPKPLDDRGINYYRIDPAVEQTADQLTALERGLTRTVAQLATVTQTAAALEPSLDPRGQRLWHDNVRVQAQVVLAIDQALLALARGYAQRGDEAQRRADLLEADARLAEAHRWLISADTPPFAGWSHPENLWGINQLRGTIAQVLAGNKATRHSKL